MKKLISVICIIVTVLALTACGKFTCDMCQQEKSGKKHESEMLGQTVTICDDCYKTAKSIFGK